MDQKWVTWIEYVMEEISLTMEYNILQKLVLNTYLSALETEKKQSNIAGLTKVNSTWIKEICPSTNCLLKAKNSL